MNAMTETAETTVTEAHIAKSAKPRAVKTKTTKPEKTTATKKTRDIGGTKLTVEQRRVAVVKAMTAMGATSATGAKTADQISAKSKLTRFDVYGILYHANKLQSEGYVKQVQIEDVRGLSYYLTAKGAKGYQPKA